MVQTLIYEMIVLDQVITLDGEKNVLWFNYNLFLKIFL